MENKPTRIQRLRKKGFNLQNSNKMNKPIRIQRKRNKGFNLQALSPDGRAVISVCRPNRWGNMYIILPDKKNKRWNVVNTHNNGELIGVFYAYQEAAEFAKEQFSEFIHYMHEAGGCWFDEIKEQLRDKHLACFCPLDSPCHADVLIEIANAE